MSKSGTNIHRLPEELLPNILKYLKKLDLLNCQRVCQAWHKPSHLALLNCIFLNDSEHANHFINAIDSNPDPDYLNAVKKIQIANIHGRMFKHSVIPASQAFPYKKETLLYKLFFRFPNLTHIEISTNYEFLETFTDELCQKLLQCCPKLETFELKLRSLYQYIPATRLVRLLLTKIEVHSISSSTDFLLPGYNIDYITSFPRMRQLKCQMIDCKDLLTVLERSPNLTELDVPTTTLPKSVREFLLVHISTRTKPEQDLLLKRLSEITVLEIHGSTFAADFVLKYLTGLKILRLRNNNKFWSGHDRMEYWSKIVDLGNTIDEVDISISQRSMESITHICNMENTLTRMPTTCDNPVIRRLEVAVDQDIRGHNLADADISFRKKFLKYSARVCFYSQESWRKFFEKRNSEWAIEELALSFYVTSYQKFKPFNSIEPYDELLKGMPSLKRIIFDTSISLKEIEENYSNVAHPTVEELTLRWRNNCHVDPRICRLRQKLPNLKHLQLINHCGWLVSSRYYHLDLNFFSLQSLSIDLEPIRFLMRSDFIMVYLTKSKSGKQYAYEISTSLSYYKRVSTRKAIYGENYIFINIPIVDLQKLQFFMWNTCRYHVHCDFGVLENSRIRTYLNINCSDDTGST